LKKWRGNLPEESGNRSSNSGRPARGQEELKAKLAMIFFGMIEEGWKRT